MADNFFTKFTSDLGDKLRLRSLTGNEQISRLFSYQLDLRCTAGDISSSDIISNLVGKKVTIEVQGPESRYFTGHISHVTSDYSEQGDTVYQATMVPWLWFLTRTSDCRVFQDKSVKDVIEEVLNESAIKGSINTSGLSEDYPALKYIVQYRETDFNFVSRLMEQWGMFYYFKHNDGDLQLCLADSTSAYEDLPENEVNFPRSHQASQMTEDHIRSWQRNYQFVSGKYVQSDYDFMAPSTDLKTNVDTKVDVPDAKSYEVYDYPGEYWEKSFGDKHTKRRMEAEEAPHDVATATSTCRSFSTGGKFKFGSQKPSDNEDGKEFLITSIRHRVIDPTFGGDGVDYEYSNSFTCIPADVTYRPPRVTPKPIISGVQSALVVGPSGEEIHCDEYGRIRIQFYWDRYGEKNETSTCWVRCMHAVAGKKWGFQSIPRIGQEVLIDFVEGDPDRPICIGGAYNDEQMPHYELPEHNAKTFIKTNSTKGGEGFNELMFDDKADNERVFIHAQRDMDQRVLKDSREIILQNRHQIIGTEDEKDYGNQTELVWLDKHQNTKRHQVEQIEGDYTLTVGHGDEDGGNYAINVEKNMAIVVGSDGVHMTNAGDQVVDIGGSSSLTVGADVKESIGGSLSQKVTGDIKTKSMSFSNDSQMDVNIKGGMNANIEGGLGVHIKAGMTATIEAGVSLTLKVGGNFVNINPGGVFIQGTMVCINSGGAAGSGAGCSPQSPDSPDSPQDGPAADERPNEPDEAHNEKSGFKSAP